MNIKDHTQSLIEIIKLSQSDPLLELEVLFKSTSNFEINRNVFDNLIKRIKGIPGIKLQSDGEVLDIYIEEQDNLRYTINGRNAINTYCKTNNISDLKKGTYSLMSKKNKMRHDINNYNLRFNVKKEEIISIDQVTIRDWYKLNKKFRYKKRISYKTKDGLFSFDLTLVKSSKSRNVSLPNSKRKKREVKDYQKKFVVKPENVSNFASWWDSLQEDDLVELRGKVTDESVFSKTLQNSNVLNEPLKCEIEIEYLGNKINYKDDYSNILNKYIVNIGIILQCIQGNSFIISNSEIKDVREEYRKVMKTNKFNAPQNITLELKHMVAKNYADYNNVLSIRRNYSVTEKADGERNLLMVLPNSKVYLINRKNEIKYFGCKLPGLEGTLFDGELILKDKDNYNIVLFAVFDIYFYKSTDLRSRILNRTEEDIKNNIEESRNEIMVDIFKNLKIDMDDEESNIMIIKKKYFYSDNVIYDKVIDEEINKLKSKLPLLNPDSEEFRVVKDNISKLKSDTKIFTEATKVLNKEYIYKIDGLVFTPVNLIVGDEKDGKPAKFGGRWNKLFKWKPPEENTIDFRVIIMKNEENEHDIRYVNYNGKIVSYKTLLLHVGYDPSIHTKFNSCRVLNENLSFKEGYHDTPFYPHNPYVKNIEYAYIPIINGDIFTENRNIIKDNMIIEFSYKSSEDEGFWWKPLRVRNNLTPNDYTTATNVWRTIHNPITKEMITTGEVENVEEEVYYYNEKNRRDISTKSLADFHSFIKKDLIKSNSKSGNKLLDVSCGRAGDLNHWLDSDLSMVVGIDFNRDNLENMNTGACNRVINMKKTKSSNLLSNMLFIWGDSSRRFKDGSAAKDDLNKYYLDVIYSNTDSVNVTNSKLKSFYGVGLKGFNLVSCQFSIHYFFESVVKLNMFLKNVSENLSTNGLFVGTCLDGEKVFNLLKDKDSVSKYKGTKELLWKIVKKYNVEELVNNDSCINLPIDVYMNSIGKTTTEWIVNFEYLKNKCIENGLELVKKESFEDIFDLDFKKNKTKYGEANKMTEELKEYSFLNMSFVFKKI